MHMLYICHLYVLCIYIWKKFNNVLNCGCLQSWTLLLKSVLRSPASASSGAFSILGPAPDGLNSNLHFTEVSR